MVYTSSQLTPATPIKDLSGILSLCNPHPGSAASRRNATQITQALYLAGIKTVGEFLACQPSFFDGIDGLGKSRLQMLTDCYTYLHASGICYEE